MYGYSLYLCTVTVCICVRLQPEIVQLVPAIAFRLVKNPDRSKYDMSSVKYVQNGGAALGPEIEAEIKKLFNLKYVSLGMEIV